MHRNVRLQLARQVEGPAQASIYYRIAGNADVAASKLCLAELDNLSAATGSSDSGLPAWNNGINELTTLSTRQRHTWIPEFSIGNWHIGNFFLG